MNIIKRLREIKRMSINLLNGDLSMLEGSIDDINSELDNIIDAVNEERNMFIAKFKMLSDGDKKELEEYINYKWRNK